MKLTEGWGEPKNDLKGKDHGFPSPPPFPTLPPLVQFFTCFQNGGLNDQILNEHSFHKKRLLCRLMVVLNYNLDEIFHTSKSFAF